MRFSTSFSKEEIAALDDLYKILLRGGDPTLLLRSTPTRTLMKKVTAMRGRAEGADISPGDP